MEEDLLERQENEINVLKSIYLNDLVDLTNELNLNNKKKQQSPVLANANPSPVIRISLKPQNSESQCEAVNEQHVKIDLKIKLPANYPNEPPKIFLENEKGLSSDLIKNLHQIVVKKANELIGNEMIFELCTVIQEYLYNHNRPPAKSFYDQRLEQTKINLEKEQLEFFDEKKKCEDMLMAEIDFAVDLKRKMLQLERKKEKELEKRERLSSTNSPATFRRERTHSIKSDGENRDTICKKLSTETESPNSPISLENIDFHPFQIEFNDPMQYFRIKCIKLVRHEKENSFSSFLGIDLKTDEIYTVYQWQINLTRNNVFDEKKLETCEAEMHKLEEEFKKLIKLNSKLIYKYLAYKFFRGTNKNTYTIQICSEYLDGNTLEFLTNQQHSYAISDNALKMFAIQLLDGLDYLHSNNIFHRSFKLSSVYLVKNSSIKISEYSLVKRLNDLNSIVSNDATSTCQGNLKSDIHQLGIVLLSLKQGEAIKNYHPQIPTNFPPELKSFLSICINENNARQLQKFDCKSLKNHPFILKNYDTNQAGATANAVTRRRRQSSHFEDQDSESEDNITTFTDYPLQSRLNTEFEVIGVVGHGAFGEVLKVKNKLDSRFYAIKRIRTNPNSKVYNKQIIREIKLLSRLNHENVVRYYSTWAERYEEIYDEKRTRTQSHESNHSESQNHSHLIRFRKVTENQDQEDEVSSSSEDSNIGGINWVKKSSDENDFSSISGSGLDLNAATTSESEQSEKEEFIDSETDGDDVKFEDHDSDGSVGFEENKSEKKRPLFSLGTSKTEDTDDSVIFAEGSSTQLRSQSSKSTLSRSVSKGMKDIRDDEYNEEGSRSESEEENDEKKSKMEYCGGKTLKYLIEQGLYNDEEKVWALLREILQGLNHIHEQSMIHRDLKPGNVLIDRNGHAKLADFGLATSRFLLQTDAARLTGSGEDTDMLRRQNSQNFGDPNNLQSLSNLNNDSISMSGAVGTALYVAPELLVPCSKNKFYYTQKVDIYSLGVMFYEMCFPFSTNMERIHVIQDLRQKEIVLNGNVDQQLYQKQVQLIKEMLNHDPAKRPSAKELLLNDMIPRKADEIALDELLNTSLRNKQSTSYNKILKAVFDQKNSKVDDFSFDATNLRNPSSLEATNLRNASSFQYLQVREHTYNTFTSVFQNYGGYFISYPLLMPWNELSNEFTKAFKLTDCSGTVLCLPYNHRLPFARYLARSGCTGIRRYHIGPVYQVMIEKLKLASLHPKEHMEASFDIVTSTHDDCLPEIEILSIINDILGSFPELLNSEKQFKLIVNHTSVINSILAYCGINSGQSKIYDLLTDFNRSLIKSQDASKENQYNWFKQRLVGFDLTEQVVEKLLNFLLKTGTPDKVLSELRSLTKSEATFSKLAKEGTNQLKQITANANIINFRVPITVSASLTLPTISHPCQYSGFIFQLLIQKKKKNEFDILASGGRYDKLISYFKTTENAKQCAVGVSFDFEKIVAIINEKSNPKKHYRSELTVCTVGNSHQASTSSQSNASADNKKNKYQVDSGHNNSSQLQDIRNRIRLFKQFSLLNKRMNISTTLAHEKFQNTDEIDEYCKKYCITSYTYLAESSNMSTSEILINNSYKSVEGPSTSQSSIPQASSSTSLSNQPPQVQFLEIKSFIDKGIRLIEKKFNLQEFLLQSNNVINNMTSYNAIHATSSSQSFSGFSTGCAQSTSGSAITFVDYISSMMTNFISSRTATPNLTSSLTNINSSSAINSPIASNSSQINITILVESANSRQQSMERGPTRKNLEARLITKINHVLTLFNSKTRVELIAMEVQDNVINCLANGLRLDMDEKHFSSNWSQCLENLNNIKSKKQLSNFRLDEMLRDFRYVKKSKVFVFYNLKSDQYKLLVIP